MFDLARVRRSPLPQSSIPALNQVNTLILNRKRTSSPRVAQPLRFLRLVCRLNKTGQPIAVGIALADEVGPILRHPTLNNIAIIVPGNVRVVRVRDVECVPDRRSMVCQFLAIFSRSASEVVRIHVALCTPGRPVDYPAPGSNPAEVAKKLIAVLAGLGVVIFRIKLENLICEFTGEFPIKRAVIRDVVDRVGAGTEFVLVVASEDWDILMRFQARGLV